MYYNTSCASTHSNHPFAKCRFVLPILFFSTSPSQISCFSSLFFPFFFPFSFPSHPLFFPRVCILFATPFSFIPLRSPISFFSLVPPRLCIFLSLSVNSILLDAFSHLYKRVCPSVRRSVRRSVRPSVTHELKSLKNAIFSIKYNTNT